MNLELNSGHTTHIMNNKITLCCLTACFMLTHGHPTTHQQLMTQAIHTIEVAEANKEETKEKEVQFPFTFDTVMADAKPEAPRNLAV